MGVEIRERYIDPYTDFGFKKLFGTELNKDLLISFLNALFNDSTMQIKDVEDNHIFYDKLTFFYLEMPKFNKREDELVTMFDKWMFALRNLSRLTDRPQALQERVFKRLFDQAEIASFTPQERREYQESVKDYWDYYSTMTTAHQKGRAEGLSEGEAKGRAEERLSNACSLLSNGVPMDVIVKSLGLAPDEIAAL